MLFSIVRSKVIHKVRNKTRRLGISELLNGIGFCIERTPSTTPKYAVKL